MIVYYLMQDSLDSFAKILDLFACLERTPTLFLHFFPRSWKDVQYLAKFARLIAMMMARKKSEVQEVSSQEHQDAKHWVLKLSTSFVKIHFMLVRRKKSNTGFDNKNLQKWHLSLISFCAKFKIRKAKSSSQIILCFHPMFAKWAFVNELTLVDPVFENFFNQLVVILR